MPLGEGRCQLEEHPSTIVFKESVEGEPQCDAQLTTSASRESLEPKSKLDAPPSSTPMEESELGEAHLSTTVIEETELGEPQMEAQPSQSGRAHVAYKGSQSEVLPSSSVVDIIPADCTSPETAKNVPGSVKRYLQRWPRGSNMGDPRFDHTTVHEANELTLATHNNEEDAKQRAELLQAVPTHVRVSL